MQGQPCYLIILIARRVSPLIWVAILIITPDMGCQLGNSPANYRLRAVFDFLLFSCQITTLCVELFLQNSLIEPCLVLLILLIIFLKESLEREINQKSRLERVAKEVAKEWLFLCYFLINSQNHPRDLLSFVLFAKRRNPTKQTNQRVLLAFFLFFLHLEIARRTLLSVLSLRICFIELYFFADLVFGFYLCDQISESLSRVLVGQSLPRLCYFFINYYLYLNQYCSATLRVSSMLLRAFSLLIF